MNGSEHPSNLSQSADPVSQPHNCKFIHTTCGLTLNSFFVGSLRVPLISHPLFFQYRVRIKWRETQCENWTLLCNYPPHLHCYLRLLQKKTPQLQRQDTLPVIIYQNLKPWPYFKVFASSAGHKPEFCKASYRWEPNLALKVHIGLHLTPRSPTPPYFPCPHIPSCDEIYPSWFV